MTTTTYTPRPKIHLDARADLNEAGIPATDASVRDFVRAYRLAADALGFDVTEHPGHEDHDGLDMDAIRMLWHEAHDSVCAGSRKGRWAVAYGAETLRARGARILAAAKAQA